MFRTFLFLSFLTSVISLKLHQAEEVSYLFENKLKKKKTLFIVLFQKNEIGQNICQIIFVPSTNIAQILMGNLLRPIKRCKRIYPKSRKNEKSTRPQSKTKFKKIIPKMVSRRNLQHVLRPNSQIHFHTLTTSTTSTEKPKTL